MDACRTLGESSASNDTKTSTASGAGTKLPELEDAIEKDDRWNDEENRRD
jgi:hypothetical protein